MAYSDKDYFHKNWECYACNRKDHLSINYKFIIKIAKADGSKANKNGNKSKKKNVVLAIITVNKMFKKDASSLLILDSEVTAPLVTN